MPLIVIPDDEPAVVSVSAAYARLNGMDVRAYVSRPSNQDELIDRIRDAKFVINVRARTRFSREVLQSCPLLRLVSIWATGTVEPSAHNKIDHEVASIGRECLAI